MKNYTDPSFGPVRWDPGLCAWVGSVTVGSVAAELHFILDREEAIPPEFGPMYQALRPRLPALTAQAVEYVRTDLAHWLEGEDSSPERISRQMRIESVQIYAGDGATVWFHGPDAIHDSGHAVEARIGAHGVLDYFCLSG